MKKPFASALLFTMLLSNLIWAQAAMAGESCSLVFKAEATEQDRQQGIQLIRDYFEQPAANHEIRTEIKVLNDGEAQIISYSGVEFDGGVKLKQQPASLILTLMVDSRKKGEIMFSLEEKETRTRWADLSALHWLNGSEPKKNAYSEDPARVNNIDLMSFQYRAVNTRNLVFKRNKNLVIETVWPKNKDGQIVVTSVEFVKNEDGVLAEIIHERRVLEGSKTHSVQNHYTVRLVSSEQIH